MHIRARFFFFLMFLTSLALVQPDIVRAQEMSSAEPGSVRFYGPLRVINLDHEPERKDDIEKLALECRRTVRQGTRLDWDETAYIIWVESRDDFETQTGFTTEFTFAAASPSRNTIWINADAWNRATPEERRQAMTHEMGHLLLGALTGQSQLPLWANEGIVQHMAGQWNLQRSQSLSVGRAIDAIPALSELEYSFPEEPQNKELAYLISYRAISEVIEDYGDEEQDIRAIMFMLSGNQSDEFIASLWRPTYREDLNARTFESVGSPWVHWAMGLFSHTTFWIIIIFLVIAAWMKLRIQKAQRDRDEMDEAWSKSLTKANIVEIYGPREGEGQSEELTPWEKHQNEKEQNPDPEPWRQD